MTDLILKYIADKKEVKIPYFGAFKQKNVPAFYDERLAALLPPAKEFFFTEDFLLNDRNFIQFVAKEKNIDINQSIAEITELVNYWKFTLQNKTILEIPNIGTFYFDDDGKSNFKGKRFEKENPDNFGLEKVNLSDLKNNSTAFNSSKNEAYKKSNNKFWWLFFIIPSAIIIYYTSQSPELIFGEKSFQKQNKIKTKSVIKKNSLKPKTIQVDSISKKNTVNAQKYKARK